jgi:uncharacterized protein YoxC
MDTIKDTIWDTSRRVIVEILYLIIAVPIFFLITFQIPNVHRIKLYL